MSKVLVTESYLGGIADAIRLKNGASTTYRPGDMAAAIEALDTSGIHPTGTKNITQNGTHDVTEYASANVSVQPNLQSKTVTQNGTVTPDQGYDGLSSVVVNVSGGGGGGVEASIAVENGALVTNGVTVVTQPVITDDQIGASNSAGLSFTFNARMEIEFDLTLKSGNHIALSFGGSNTTGGVYLISPTQFHLYANGARFTVPITLSENVKYRAKVVFTYTAATLYVDGTQVAVGQSDYVQNAIKYLLSGNSVAFLYNQSAHSEYSNDLIDNVVIQSGGSGLGYTGTFISAIDLSQGGVWIDTGIDISGYTTLDCVNKTSGNYTQILPVAVSSIPIKTGSADVFLTVFKNGGKDFNLRIENGTLRMSFNGTGSSAYETLVFGDGNLSSLLQGGTT